MTDLEDRLARELSSIADAETGPRVDAPGVRRVAGRERRRRRVLAVGAVAAAVALVGVVSVVVPRLGSAPVPVAGSERPLGLAWGGADGTVHLPSGRTVQVDGLSEIVSRADTTMVATGDAGEQTWWLVHDGTGGAPSLEKLVVGATGTPVVAVGGGHVAFMRISPRILGFQLVSRDVDSPESQTTDVGQGSGGRSVLGVSGVDDTGRVLVERRSATPLLWDPAGGVVPVTGLADGASVVLLTGGSAQGYSSDRLTTQRIALPSDGVAVLGPEGRAGYATGFNDDATAYVDVADPTSGASAVSLVSVAIDGSTSSQGPLSLPGGRWSPLGWESADEVVLSARVSGAVALRRCSVSTNTCERVSTEGIDVLPTT